MTSWGAGSDGAGPPTVEDKPQRCNSPCGRFLRFLNCPFLTRDVGSWIPAFAGMTKREAIIYPVSVYFHSNDEFGAGMTRRERVSGDVGDPNGR